MAPRRAGRIYVGRRRHEHAASTPELPARNNSAHPAARKIERHAAELPGTSATQYRSNPVSGHSRPKAAVFQISAGRRWQAILRVPGTPFLRTTRPGWRRSANRTGLQANSLLTGNFTGKCDGAGVKPRLLPINNAGAQRSHAISHFARFVTAETSTKLHNRNTMVGQMGRSYRASR